MDWEKKTAQRPDLVGSAADAFNDTKTPGQALLSSLQRSEVARKDRYFGTVDAKMKAAREKLPNLEPHHPVKSDQAIFGKPSFEVDALLTTVPPEKGSMHGVERMKQSRAVRHKAAWERFTAARDAARTRQESGVATLVSEFKVRLAASDREIQEAMQQLQDDRVMLLEEGGVMQVWQAVADTLASRAAWIEALGAALEGAEEARGAEVGAALEGMLAAMNEVAHLGPSEVAMVMEEEALALDQSVLSNRGSYAGLLRRLYTAEVELECSCRGEWEAGHLRWRRLRSQHAMATFVARLHSAEFADPPQRLALFGEVRERQAAAHQQMEVHLKKAAGLTPPGLSSEAVAAWRAAAEALAAAWNLQRSEIMLRLHQAEDSAEAAAQQLYGALVQEVLGYQGYPEEEAQAMLDVQCGAAVSERRAAAEQLQQQVEAYLEGQAAEWRAAGEAVGSWLGGLAFVVRDHRERTEENDRDVREQLRQLQREFDTTDAEREAALEAAIEGVRQGASEVALDQGVEAAMQRLGDIEAGYRDFHTALVGVVRAHPSVVDLANRRHQLVLCSLLHLQPNVEVPEDAPPRPATPPPASEASQAEVTAPADAPPADPPSKPPSKPASRAPSGKPAPPSKAPPPTPPEPIPEPERPPSPPPPAPLPQLQVPGSCSYGIVKDIATALIPAASGSDPNKAPGPPAPTPPPSEPTIPSTTQAPNPAAPDIPSAGPPIADSSTQPRPPSPSPSSTDAPPAQQLPPSCPGGAVCCCELPIDHSAVRQSCQTIQVALLRDMERHAARSVAEAEEFADEREGAFTEELGGRLRGHRPRIGRVEEDVRRGRSVELLGQRRRVEGHLREMTRAVLGQEAAFREALQKAGEVLGRGVEKLRGYEALLGQCQGPKSLAIRGREAGAFRTRLQNDIAGQCRALQQLSEGECGRVAAANRRFEEEALKGFDQGGKFDQDNLDAYRAGLKGVEAHLAAAEGRQKAEAEQLQQQKLQEVEAAMQLLQDVMPAHEEDLQMLDLVEHHLDAARKKARKDLDANTAAAVATAAELDRLSSLLSSPPPGPPQALPHCQALLASAATLRAQLLTQAHALQFLESTDMPPPDPSSAAAAATALPDVPSADLSVHATTPEALATALKDLEALMGEAAGQVPPSAGGKAGPVKAAAAPAPAVAAKRAPSAASPAGAKGVQGGVGVKLAADIEAVIDACKVEVDKVAREYYKKKDPKRPIKFPAQIPPTPAEMLARSEAVLAQLRTQLAAHVSDRSKELRVQVIRANTLLERLPAAALSALVAHELAAAGQQRWAAEARSRGQVAALQQQAAAHQRTLHPHMAHPNRRHELDALQASERQRAEAASQAASQYAQEAWALLALQGPLIAGRAMWLLRHLLGVLDGMLGPTDLPAMGEGEEGVFELPRRSLRSLHRLSAALDEAAGLLEASPLSGAAVAAPPLLADTIAAAEGAAAGAAKPTSGKARGPAGGKAPATPPKGAGKPKLQAAALPVEAAAEEPAKKMPPRGHRAVQPQQWSVAPGRFTPESLGWSLAAAAAAPVPTGAAATAAAVGARGSARAGAGAGAAVTAAAGEGACGVVLLAGMDTLMHRAAVSAYASSLHQVEGAMKAAAAATQLLVGEWRGSEATWGTTWDALVANLDDF